MLGQSALVIIGLGLVSLSPPEQGTMLLVPLHGGSGAIVDAAIGSGARLLGPGQLPGSVVVSGRRSSIMPAVLAAGAIVTLGSTPTCGPDTRNSGKTLA